MFASIFSSLLSNINSTDLSKLSLVHLDEHFVSIFFDNFIYNSIGKKINILFSQIFYLPLEDFHLFPVFSFVASEIVLPSPWIWINILNNKYWINMEFKYELGNWDICLSNLIQLVRLHKRKYRTIHINIVVQILFIIPTLIKSVNLN